MRQEIKEEQVQQVKQEILDYDYGDQYQDGMVRVYTFLSSFEKKILSFVKIELICMNRVIHLIKLFQIQN